jgi:hypothetical protein
MRLTERSIDLLKGAEASHSIQIQNGHLRYGKQHLRYQLQLVKRDQTRTQDETQSNPQYIMLPHTLLRPNSSHAQDSAEPE